MGLVPEPVGGDGARAGEHLGRRLLRRERFQRGSVGSRSQDALQLGEDLHQVAAYALQVQTVGGHPRGVQSRERRAAPGRQPVTREPEGELRITIADRSDFDESGGQSSCVELTGVKDERVPEIPR